MSQEKTFYRDFNLANLAFSMTSGQIKNFQNISEDVSIFHSLNYFVHPVHSQHHSARSIALYF